MTLRRSALVLLVACARPQPVIAPAAPVVAPLPSYALDTLRVEGAPPLDRALRRTLEARSQARGDQLLDLSDDGTRVLALSAGYLVELDAPGAAPRARPPDPELLVDTALFARDGALVLVADRGGDEQTRLYRQDAGTPRLLGDGAVRVSSPIWDRDRRSLVWGGAIGTRSELWVGDGAGAARKVFTGDGLWRPLDVSRDGLRILALHEVSESTSAVYRIEVATGDAVALTPVAPGIAAPAARFGDDGRVYAISDAGGDHRALVELTWRGVQSLTPDLPWDVTAFASSRDGQTLAFATDEDGASVLRVYDRAARAHHVVAGAPVGGVIDRIAFAAGAPRFAISVTDARHPREIFSFDVGTERAVQWTHAELGGIAPDALRVPAVEQVMRAGVRVPMLVYEPGASHAPVVVDLHGGPEDQWLPSFDGFAQFLVGRGYAIVRPNVRGSTGYGRAYAALDDGRQRTEAVRDVGAVLDWIATRPELDAGRVVVMGTSYGGYLALASLLAYPDRLRGGIDLVGIADFVTFLEGTSEHRRDQRRAEYGDERDPATRAFLAGISPLAHAAEIRRPLLVAHGKRDERVPAADADRLVAAVRAAGQPVWYLTADDEGHGFTRVEHRVVFQTLVTQFLDTVTARPIGYRGVGSPGPGGVSVTIRKRASLAGSLPLEIGPVPKSTSPPNPPVMASLPLAPTADASAAVISGPVINR